MYTYFDLFFFLPENNLLTCYIFLILGIILIFFCIEPEDTFKTSRKLATITSLITFFFSLKLWFKFDTTSSKYQYLFNIDILKNTNLNLSLKFGIDGISLPFLVLTTFIILLCLLSSYSSIKKNSKHFYLNFLILELLLLIVFTSLNLLGFYIAFETILIPMLILIGYWGSRERRIRASFFLFFYTLVGSIPMLAALIYIYCNFGTLDYITLLNIDFSTKTELLCWLAFFLSFATKLPMLPVHIWLPEAHVEAPTAGSALLAGVLLKLGIYGLLRFSLPLFPFASVFFRPFILIFAIIGIFYCSLTAIRQTDLKRIIAYSSIGHMNFALLGIFSFTKNGIIGALTITLSHAFISTALFFCVGALYDRYHSRLISYYSGLAHRMPIFTTFFFFFILANTALPGTASFVGEFLIFCGLFKTNHILLAILGSTGMLLGTVYSLWLFSRVCYGNTKNKSLKKYEDLTRNEILILVPLLCLTLLLGIYSTPLVSVVDLSVNKIILFF